MKQNDAVQMLLQEIYSLYIENNQMLDQRMVQEAMFPSRFQIRTEEIPYLKPKIYINGDSLQAYYPNLKEDCFAGHIMISDTATDEHGNFIYDIDISNIRNHGQAELCFEVHEGYEVIFIQTLIEILAESGISAHITYYKQMVNCYVLDVETAKAAIEWMRHEKLQLYALKPPNWAIVHDGIRLNQGKMQGSYEYYLEQMLYSYAKKSISNKEVFLDIRNFLTYIALHIKNPQKINADFEIETYQEVMETIQNTYMSYVLEKEFQEQLTMYANTFRKIIIKSRGYK